MEPTIYDQTYFLGLIEKFWWIFLAVITWSLVWKGIALWRAAQNNSKPWFIALLLVNTLGILEIIYILGFSKKPNWFKRLFS